MSSRMDNLQTVFDRTDWKKFRMQVQALNARVGEEQDELIQGLLNWLDVVQVAAEMDGYQVNAQKEPTRR